MRITSEKASPRLTHHTDQYIQIEQEDTKRIQEKKGKKKTCVTHHTSQYIQIIQEDTKRIQIKKKDKSQKIYV